MGKHIKSYMPIFHLNEIVHGDLNNLNLKIYLPKKKLDIEKIETKLNNLLHRTTQYHETNVYKNIIVSSMKLDASTYKFTIDYTDAFIKEFRQLLEPLKLKVDTYNLDNENLIVYLK
jgi:hypothetical protein